jgi:exodeoxyribonuclease VII large subunit
MSAFREQRAHAAARLESAATGLSLVSPQAVLDRGYAIVRDPGGRVLRDAAGLAVGDPIVIRLAAGEIGASVDSLVPAPPQ